MKQYHIIHETIIITTLYYSSVLDSTHSSSSYKLPPSSMEYHHCIMNKLRQKSPFLTTRPALSHPRSCAFGISHYQHMLLNCPVPEEDFESWKSYYATGTTKFTMAGNHCERIKVTSDIY